MAVSYLDGTWFSDENDDYLPISRYDAVDLLLKAINAAQENNLGTVMQILCMDDHYTMAEAVELIPIRMKELSVQAKLELDLPDVEV